MAERITVTVQAPQRGAIISTTSGFGDSLGPYEKKEISVGMLPQYTRAGCFLIGAPPGAPEDPVVTASDKTREELVAEAVAKLVAEGDPKSFTDGGKPKASAVKRIAGFDVSGDEVLAAFSASTDISD